MGKRAARVKCILVLAACIAFRVAPPAFGVESDVDFKQFLMAMKANAEKVRTAQGVFRDKSEHFREGEVRIESSRVTFSVKDDKLRFDQTWDEEGRHPEKTIIDGRQRIWTGPLIPERAQYTVHVDYDNWAGMRGLEFRTNFRVDPRRIFSPCSITADELLTRIEMIEGSGFKSDKPLWEVSREPDGQYKVVRRHVNLEDMSLMEHSSVYWFDPKKDFALTRDMMVVLGTVATDVKRTYEEKDGAWVIATMTMDDRDPYTGEMRTHKERLFESFDINVEIAEDTFTIKGLGLGAQTEVDDRIAGVTYPLDPTTALVETADRMIDLIDEGPPLPDVGQQQSQTERAEDTVHRDDGRAGAQNQAESSAGGLQVLSVIVICVCAVLILLFLVARLRRTRESSKGDG